MNFENIARVSLHDFPTPLQRLERFGREIGLPHLYIKRDDHMLLGLGGNKIRNLEFWMAEAITLQADIIVAAGGLQSNQCRLTAAAAAKLGFKCLLVHNDQQPDVLEGNMLLNYLLGAESIYLGRVSEEVRTIEVEKLIHNLRLEGHRPYLIGDPGLGALGYANAAEEIFLQSCQMGIDLKHIVIVGAMCVTAAGFLYGTSLLNSPFQVHTISVEYPLQIMIQKTREVWDAAIRKTGKEPPFDFMQFTHFYDDYLGEGYAIPSPTALESIKLLARTEGIFIEQVYSAKTFSGLIQLREKGILSSEDPVCVIHTGGYGALFAQNSILTK